MNRIILKITIILSIFLCSCSGGGTAGTGGVSELKGFIVNENEQPLSNVTVNLSSLQQSAVSDQSGSFTLSVDKEGGKYSFQFDGAGLKGVLLEVEIPKSNNQVIVVFKGNTKENKVTESGIRVEDRSSSDDSNDDSGDDDQDDSRNDSSDDSSDDQSDDHRDDQDNHGGNGSDDSSNDSEDNSGDDSQNDGNDDSSHGGGSNSGSGSGSGHNGSGNNGSGGSSGGHGSGGDD